jgi:membrane protease YdiL (CAAX protease family)
LGQRYVLSLAGGIIAEWLFVIAAWLVLKSRNQSFRDLGTWRLGNWAGWGLALLLAGLSIASNLRFLPRMGIPISYAFAPQGFHLVAALATGITAGFCEELLFRGFLMTEFATAGYGKVAQVILPGIAFGFSHLGYSVHGFGAAIGIMVPTGILGMLWGGAYLLGRRGLLPCIVAHFLNDSTALPWIGFFMFKGSLG